MTALRALYRLPLLLLLLHALQFLKQLLGRLRALLLLLLLLAVCGGLATRANDLLARLSGICFLGVLRRRRLRLGDLFFNLADILIWFGFRWRLE